MLVFFAEQKIAVKTIPSIFTISYMWLRGIVLFLARELSPHLKAPNTFRGGSAGARFHFQSGLFKNGTVLISNHMGKGQHLAQVHCLFLESKYK